MIKTIQPAVPAKQEFICDHTKENMGDYCPCVITLSFGYGSNRDTTSYELHLNAESGELALQLLKYGLLNGESLEKFIKEHSQFDTEKDKTLSGHELIALIERFRANALKSHKVSSGTSH